LFIDELHTIVARARRKARRRGEHHEAALARGELRCVGATTLDDTGTHRKDPRSKGDSSRSGNDRRWSDIAIWPD